MNVQVPKTISINGPVVLICKDEGGITPGAYERVHIAIYFDNREKAEAYSKRLLLGKNPRIEIFSVRMP